MDLLKDLFYSNIDEIRLCLRILLAFGCGAIVGLQRKKAKQDNISILRTHILLCVGAALVAATSELLCGIYPNVDVTRISAQVISGISFVGIGVIVKHGNSINGLTTAASLWAVGAVGISLGSGAYILGIFSTLLILALLLITKEKTPNE